MIPADLLPGSFSFVKAAAVFAGVLILVRLFVRAHHPFPRFGPANQVTTIRAALVALIAGFIGEPNRPALATTAAVVSGVVTLLDGLDGWLARRTRLASAFGARFDMEIDALLILVLSILAWQYDKAGGWVVLAGLLRYGFVIASWVLPWMNQPLPPSRRRQSVCVLQIVGSSVILLPPVVPPVSVWLAAMLLATLSWSFVVDVVWLWRQRTRVKADRSYRSGAEKAHTYVVLAAALLVLNAAVTFHNVWPTPAIGWSGELSVELAVLLLIIAAIRRRAVSLSAGLRRVIVVVWLILAIGRYIDVTAPALWGRPINFYWDLQFVPDVAAMIVRAAKPWMVAIAALGVIAFFAMAFLVVSRSLAIVWSALGERRHRTLAVTVSGLLIAGFVLQRVAGVPRQPTFPTPVAETYARQAEFVVSAMTGGRSLPPSPSFDADLSRVKGADVLLFFIESYGAVVFERPEFSSEVAHARDVLAAAVRDSGHDVVSAFVESPTFGGSSWYAHLTLLSGIEVRDPDTNALLMTAHRDTMPTAFARHGYRTVAMMPGLWYPWPEGAFYGFTDIYNGARLDYHGPSFGWWSMTDQFVLASLDASERGRRSRPPLFVFFPTISTHTPFAPTPPYQSDWPRMLTPRPYDMPALDAAYSSYPDWLNLAPSYLTAVSYSYQTLAGYLRQHTGEDFVMILIGDHEPPALVSGPAAPWDVPVHVIARRRDILDRLLAEGFVTGLTPQRPALGKMHTLTPILLKAFSR